MALGPGLPDTNSCHDITVYEKFDLAAGSCEGNGLLIDISDPANPKRIDAVADPLFAYWHGATFSNDGKKVFFTDEWGGGTAARCRATDQLSWGANAIYEIVNRKLVFQQLLQAAGGADDQENCVSHIPSLVPIPGRDIFVQAWYQGGASLVDFTDPSKPKEIGYFDRGPISASALVLGGFWSTYWYNGAIYGSEIARGFDVFDLTPTADLTQAEIDLAKQRTVKAERFNAQSQDQFTSDVAAGDRAGGRQRAGDAVADARPRRPASARSRRAWRGRTRRPRPATVTSTAGDALLSVADPSPQHTGHLVNGTFCLPQPLQARARNAANTGHGVQQRRLDRLAVEPVDVQRADLQRRGDAASFSQRINANDALRTGTYSKTLTFTLSTTQP